MLVQQVERGVDTAPERDLKVLVFFWPAERAPAILSLGHAVRARESIPKSKSLLSSHQTYGTYISVDMAFAEYHDPSRLCCVCFGPNMGVNTS